MSKQEQIISAQVILRAASGKAPDGRAAITAANITDYLPSEETSSRAKSVFKASGFEVGNVVGNSFSISAPVSAFEKVFKTSLHAQENGGIAIGSKGHKSYELPARNFPEAIAELVHAITFTPPPDFGPTSY